ncbi:MAG: 16S rRNA (uracil(1498)-N(3))-methyltransferase [Lentisphaeria bacterium]|nr:16S rRNA (uracil(1498)-N(3))-methyltransferase [Lentisphaeria bacterium]
MHLFRYEALGGIVPGDMVRLDKEESSHLFRTLRAEPGEQCRLMDGAGHFALAEVLSGKMLKVLNIETAPLPALPLLHLYIAPPRRQKMDQILRQAAELGVWRIIPMTTERSVALPDIDSINGRWKEVLFEGCKQSGNPFLPQVADPMKFADALADSSQCCAVSFYGSVRQRELPEPPGKPESAAWFIGPEGGFTDAEEEIMLNRGIQPLHFGNWTLRVETAAICGLSLIHEKFKA